MDRFLKEQETGELLDVQNPFTVERRLSRKKLLESIPQEKNDAVYRLLDGALGEFDWRASQGRGSLHCTFDESSVTELKVSLPLSIEQIQEFVEELRQPFSRKPGYSKLAKALLRAAGLKVEVGVSWSRSLLGRLRASGSPVFQLGEERLAVPDSLPETRGPGLSLTLKSLKELPPFQAYHKSLSRWPYRYGKQEEPILPLESRARGALGFFDYRCRAFTAIRTFARPPQQSASLRLDFWPGPYSELDPQTLLLEKKKPGKFLFLRWKPSFGRPTFLYRWSGYERAYGSQECGATFWVDSSDTPAHVQFYSAGVVSDFVSVEGPPGLTGLVCWPGLEYDLWGTRLVRDSEFERALVWTQKEVGKTADCLSRNLGRVVERLRCSDLFKGNYAEETVARIETLWS